jgi:S1-C subfamily serine protease
MPLDKNMIWNLAEMYLDGTISGEDMAFIKDMSAKDPAFSIEFQESVNLLTSIKASGEHKAFRNMVAGIAAQQKKPETVKKPAGNTIPLRTHYWRTAAIAAGIAILTSLSTIWAVRHSNSRIASQYSLLKRDLEKYKRSQNQLINNIKDQKNVTIPAEAKFGGTGFALTNDGYIVTNYHVVEGADSIYIQNSAGHYYKAHALSFDKKADIAILQVENKDFRFSKSDLPYSFATGKSHLGAKVYSLGFPQDEIVYNEGYISSKNGYEGDSMQYRLQMPANPGQSGAPVVDANGNIIAIITGKESESEGTTYAVSSKALLHLVNNMPKRKSIRLPKSNKLGYLSREQQIEKLENYTCSIKVYK